MDSLITSICCFVLVLAGAFLGLGLRAALPAHHRDTESRELVKLGMGFVGTMSALLLGLLVASTKSSYDAQKSKIAELSSRVVFIDRLLADFGPHARSTRAGLHESFARLKDQIWPADHAAMSWLDPTAIEAQGIYEHIQALVPANEAQTEIKSQALAAEAEASRLRWTLFEQSMSSSIPRPLLIMLVVWLTIIFIGYGYCSPRHATTIITLTLCAISVASALFLILEMDHPFGGMIRIGDEVVRATLAHLGKAETAPPAP